MATNKLTKNEAEMRRRGKANGRTEPEMRRRSEGRRREMARQGERPTATEVKLLSTGSGKGTAAAEVTGKVFFGRGLR
ncbi:hypothetical protein GOBAR_DD18488 [Gossypium barbadense]|nr:hypothetical protein GOBAR_DD18488 [Gossypium barbadense]